MVQHQPQSALRKIPSLDTFLQAAEFAELKRGLVTRESRAYLAELREQVLAGALQEAEIDALFAGSEAVAAVLARCAAAEQLHHRRVVNATGIVLHTGIGRAPMAPAAIQAVQQALGYAIVEVDPHSGQRNQRESCVSALLQDILGVEAGLVVNNNAAATTLVLAALAAGKEVVTSRGELVEIGGGFRVPEVMRQAGCHMVEVGATNRTHLRDYAAAIGEETAMLMKVHTSNFRLVGFQGVPSLREMVDLARERGIYCIEDLGSGLICEAPVQGLVHEPRVQDSLATGVDICCFSGDKLLGGPQCGVIVGSEALIQTIRAHPLYRAMRCDKAALAGLEATLRIYRDGDPLAEIPSLAALGRSPAELQARAEILLQHLQQAGTPALAQAEIVVSESFAGSGANPAHPIPSWAVAFPGSDALCDALRQGAATPVFARLTAGKVHLDLRSLEGEDLAQVARLVQERLDAFHP